MNDEVKTPVKALVLSKIATIRRDNLRTLCNIHGTSALARKLGYRSPSFLSQMVGPKPAREVTEKSAREFEQRMSLPEGVLDREGYDPTLPEQPVAPQSYMPLPAVTTVPVPATTGNPLVSDVIRVIAEVLTDENLDLSPDALAEVKASSTADALMYGKGAPRKDFVKNIIRLLK